MRWCSTERIAGCAGLMAMIAALAGGARPAAADDTKVYPAFLCEEPGTAPSGNVNRSEYRVTKSGGALGATATVLCPIIHDSFGGVLIQDSMKQVKVDVVDTLFAGDISCALIQRRPNGFTYSYDTRKTTGVLGAVQTLTFNLDVGGGGIDDTYYYLKCELPTNAPPQVVKLLSYEVTEDNG